MLCGRRGKRSKCQKHGSGSPWTCIEGRRAQSSSHTFHKCWPVQPCGKAGSMAGQKDLARMILPLVVYHIGSKWSAWDANHSHLRVSKSHRRSTHHTSGSEEHWLPCSSDGRNTRGHPDRKDIFITSLPFIHNWCLMLNNENSIIS